MTPPDDEARVAAGRLKPGSILQNGSVVDYRGKAQMAGPCFIPATIPPARKGALGSFGWCLTPARDWPSVLPAQGLACITRAHLATNPNTKGDETP